MRRERRAAKIAIAMQCRRVLSWLRPDRVARPPADGRGARQREEVRRLLRAGIDRDHVNRLGS